MRNKEFLTTEDTELHGGREDFRIKTPDSFRTARGFRDEKR
jgi:hypothetical protein